MAERLARIQLLIDTTANWQAANPILLNGEIGLEIKSNNEIAFKAGDGVTAWNLLGYVSFTPSEVEAIRDELQAQIDNIVVAASEGGDSSTEVAQARVNASGVTYATLKARLDAMDATAETNKAEINAEITDLKSDLSEINGRFVYGKNLYNPETAVDGKWINNITQSPPQIESLSYLCYNFVKITGAGDYYFKWPVGSVGENFYKTSIYDETKAYLFERNAIKISGDGNNTIVKLTISQGDISEGAFYIGYNQSISYKNELMVVKGEYPSEYIPYVSGFDMPELNVKSDQIENYPVVTPDVINFFDKSKSILGKWINNVTQSPPVIESLGYLLYNMVEVTEGDYYFKWAEASIGANAYKVSLYNSNLEYISNTNAVKISGTGNDTIVRLSITKDHILNGVKYVGYNQIISKNDELMFVKGSYPDDYIPYNNYLTIPNVRIYSDQIINSEINPFEYTGEEVRVFTKGFFAGDSLTKGTFNRNDTGSEKFEVIPKYSYPSYFAKLYGCIASNWGIGGETTKSWYELVNADTRATDYDFAVIALGANDTKINDITVSKTYYQKIIDMFNSDVKKVKIFCCTVTPAYTETNPTFYNAYNEMVRQIVNENTNCYLVDLAIYSKCHDNTVYAQGHLTALGYLQLAKEIGSAISYIIANNSDEFKYVHFIGTDYSHS